MNVKKIRKGKNMNRKYVNMKRCKMVSKMKEINSTVVLIINVQENEERISES